MSPKSSSKKSRLKDYIDVLSSPQLTIFSENGETATVYNPKNDADIVELCKAANLEKFIKDKENVSYPHLLVFESSRYARGVVTNEPIKKNQVICEYLGEIDSLDKVVDRDRVARQIMRKFRQTTDAKMSSEELERAVDAYVKFVSAYAFELTRKSGPDDCMLAHKHRSLAAFINHHTTDPNVHVDVVKQSIRYIASRNIEKGEQLRIDYGPDYEYEERMYYIPSVENHLRRGKFLAENFHYYHDKPLKLTQAQKKTLGTEFDNVMIPQFMVPVLRGNRLSKAHKLTDYEKRLLILEVVASPRKGNPKFGYDIYVPENQQNIMPLLFACACSNAFAITLLANDPSVDVFSKTVHDKDALIVLLNAVKSESKFIQLAKSILRYYADNVKRIDYLGSDDKQNSVLHLLVARGWSKAIKWFDHKIFFAVVDMDDFDPLMLAIALGKIDVLKALFKLNTVKKKLRSLLLIREEIADTTEYVLKRALKKTPRDKYQEVMKILLKVTKSQPKVTAELKKIFYKITN